MKLIDGDRLREMLRSETTPMTEYGKGIHDGFAFTIATIETMPETVRHGRWEERKWEDVKAATALHTIAYARCSECCLWCEQVRDWTARIEYDYCPHCGAKMGGDENAAD